jgi:hypothetical protein
MQQIDIQIAAIAFTLGNCTVVSGDSDLMAVPGLKVKDWAVPNLSPQPACGASGLQRRYSLFATCVAGTMHNRRDGRPAGKRRISAAGL